MNSDDQSNLSDQSDESQILNKATQRSDWPKWEIVMRAEFNSLVENQTWDLINRSDTKMSSSTDELFDWNVIEMTILSAIKSDEWHTILSNVTKLILMKHLSQS
jgi:hypothetical protein